MFFLGSVALALVASEVLVRGLDRLGVRLHLQAGLLGLLTALGADAPEISSALLSLRAGHADLGLGVVLGSNIFNLAALLGLGAMVAGHVRVRRVGLGLNGTVVVLTTPFVAGLLTGRLSPVLTSVLLVLIFAPYLAILSVQPYRVSHLPWPASYGRLLMLAVREINHEGPGHAEASGRRVPGCRWQPILLILPALLVIVLASEGMVVGVLRLASEWHIPNQIVGVVLLASVTSLPNAYAAVRLARQQRGSAVVSEAFNSNTINILAGICLPALVLQGVVTDNASSFDLLWLLGMTVVTILLLAQRRGLNRPGGAVIIGLYLCFVLLSVRG